MKFQNLSANQLIVWTGLLLGLLAAVVLGSAVGSSDMRMVAGTIALIPVAIIFVKLKTDIWVLLPIGWYLAGSLPWLPLPFTVRDLCFLTVIFFYTLFYATRALPWKRKTGTIDYLIYINLAYLVVVFARNPVGFWAMQSSMVGGRPYFEIALAFFGFMILSRVRISESIAGVFPLFFVIPAWIIAILDAVGLLFPQTSYTLAMIYSGVGSTTLPGMMQEEAQFGETRFSAMLNAGWTSVLALCAKYNPITLISPLYPARFAMLVVAFGAIFLSGFRSTLLFGFASFLLSAVLRRRGKDLWIAGAAMVLAVITLISLQGTAFQLPKTMQRALSWLPGDWSEEATRDAEASSQWRYDMWVWAWNDSRIMKDKVWGQGFGLSLEDMNIIASSLMAGSLAAQDAFIGGASQESFMITGSFHSGPISSIRYVGVVGFFLYLPLIFYLAAAAWKMCRRAYKTPAFSLALFIGIPIIYEPFNFLFIFGGYEGNVPQTLFWAGLLNMTNAYVAKFHSSSSGTRAIGGNPMAASSPVQSIPSMSGPR